MYGISSLTCVPLRALPDGKSEMVSMLLFGETYAIKEEKDGWYHIIATNDQYECWINSNQHTALSEADYREISQAPEICTVAPLTLIRFHDVVMQLMIGSTLPFYHEGSCRINEETWHLTEHTTDGNVHPETYKIRNSAMKFLNAPYLWGGRSLFGIDCSGFTQLVFKLSGIHLLRDARQQATQGEVLRDLSEARMGDLAFFSNKSGNISHVGILLEDGKIIHASGRVRIDNFDKRGILNLESGNYSHELTLIKRIIN